MTDIPDADPSSEQPRATTQPPAEQEAPGRAPQRVLLRRAPRYRAFVSTGILAGLAVALVLSRFSPSGTGFSGGSTLGYLAMVLALLGAMLGAAVAVLVERPRRR